MPWKETDKMEQKELFIKEMLKNEKPFKHLCADFGISEKTGHKWKNRFYEQGKIGLVEQSRAAHSHVNEIDGDTAAELICIKMLICLGDQKKFVKYILEGILKKTLLLYQR